MFYNFFAKGIHYGGGGPMELSTSVNFLKNALHSKNCMIFYLPETDMPLPLKIGSRPFLREK